jgi:hypothetical protein
MLTLYTVKNYYFNPILLRERASVPSAAALGRLTARENLFFRPGAKRHKKRSKSAKTAHERKRKLYNLKADGARQIIGFDIRKSPSPSGLPASFSGNVLTVITSR